MSEFLAVLLSLIFFGLGWFLKSYLGEKGKNLATHEDIDSIVQQLRKTTETAEYIKAQVSGELWLGQTRWQLRRELYARLLEALSDARAHLYTMNRVMEREHRGDELADLVAMYGEAAARVRRARAVAGIILGPDAVKALDEFSKATAEGADSAHGKPYREKMTYLIDRASELLARAAETDLLGVHDRRLEILA